MKSSFELLWNCFL